MNLRPYQIDIIDAITDAWESGVQNICVQLPTGAGKTVIFSHILKRHMGSALAIAHRNEIIHQMSCTLARHEIAHTVIASRSTRRELKRLNPGFVTDNSRIYIGSIDTLTKRTPPNNIGLVIIDEAHHILRANKWGKLLEYYPKARGLFPTATPVRCDKRGLGRDSDGVFDVIIQGPPMRQLITEGYLTDYRIFAPPNNFDRAELTITSTGEFNRRLAADSVSKSQITGDIVKEYLKVAPGKLGITFAVSVDVASELVDRFQSAGVPARLITAMTAPAERSHIMQQFRSGTIKQLINVDILGEGVDIPDVECISFGRPTKSYSLYCQQFGRALRSAPGKTHALIIDHVGNVLEHGLPDAPRLWSLDRQVRTKVKSKILLKTCLSCYAVYSSLLSSCPQCNHVNSEAIKINIAHVKGDLTELDIDILQKLRAGITGGPMGLLLDSTIELYAGNLKYKLNYTDGEIYKDFYRRTGIDVLTARGLADADKKRVIDKIAAG